MKDDEKRIGFLERVLRLLDRIGRTRSGTIAGLAILVATGLGLVVVRSRTGLVLPVAIGVILAATVQTLGLLLDETAPSSEYLDEYRARLDAQAGDSALQGDEIEDAVRRSRRTRDELRAYVTAAAEQTWSSLSRETSMLHDVNRRLHDALWIEALLNRRRWAARLLAALLVLAGVGLLTVWFSRLPRQEDLLVGRSPQSFAGSLLVLVGVTLLLAGPRWRRALALVPPRLDPAIVALDLELLWRERASRMGDLLNLLTEHVRGLVRERLNKLIEELDERDRSPVLGVESAPGLGERFDETYLVTDTDMAAKVWRTVEAIGGGGTIGIAGPRGSGKSILLRLLCRPGRVEARFLSERQQQMGREWSWLPVPVSAPVSYEPQEFLAHLFASLCRELLGMTGQADIHQSRADSALRRWPARTLVELSLGLSVLVAGAALVALPSRLGVRQAAYLVAIGMTGLLLGVVGTMTAYALARRQRLQRLTATNLYASELERRPFGGSLAGALTIGGVGWALLVAASSRAPDEALNLVGAMIVGVGSFALLYPVLSNMAQSGPAEWARRLGHSPMLVREAWTRLRELQFQQTVSESLSEAVKLQNPAKLPLSVESSSTRSVSMAQLPITYPELVAQFRTFCDHVVEQRLQLVVGIDELDKIDSPGTARDFLNGIKAIFGQPGCYFIASVSEDAIESFEQRGLPFRDVFESCFDDIIAVQGLSFAEARTVLSRRVIGLADQFVAFCYCMSGGLPRDLIRVARAVVAEYPIGTSLAKVSRGTVETWLKARVRTTLRRIGEVPGTGDLRDTLKGCIAVELSAPDGAALVEFGRDLKQTAAGLAKDESQHRDDGSRLSPSVALDQLATFCYFCGTVATFFDDRLTWTRLAMAAGLDSSQQSPAPLDDLASARRAFGLNAQLAWEHVEAFRRRWEAMASGRPTPAASQTADSC